MLNCLLQDKSIYYLTIYVIFDVCQVDTVSYISFHFGDLEVGNKFKFKFLLRKLFSIIFLYFPYNGIITL